MSDEISFTICVSNGENATTLNVSHTSENTFDNVLREALDYLKIDEEQRDELEAWLGDARIKRKDYEKSIKEIGIENDDHVDVEKIEHDDARTKTGYIWVMNSTNEEWLCTFKPYIARQKNIPENEIGIQGPAVPIPVVGDVEVGAFNRAVGRVDMDLEDLDAETVTTSKKIGPHMACRVYYENWIEGRDPHPVRVSIYDQENNLKESITPAHKTAFIIQKDGKTIPAKMKKRFGVIGKTVPTWKPELPPSNLPDQTFDPHNDIAKGDACNTCQE